MALLSGLESATAAVAAVAEFLTESNVNLSLNELFNTGRLHFDPSSHCMPAC